MDKTRTFEFVGCRVLFQNRGSETVIIHQRLGIFTRWCLRSCCLRPCIWQKNGFTRDHGPVRIGRNG